MLVAPFWIVGHRCNNKSDIKAAMGSGANGIEFDVVSDGDDFKVYHPGSIDFSVPSLRAHLEDVLREQVPLVYIDYKGDDYSSDACARLVAVLRAAGIHTSGIAAIVSVASLANVSFFASLPDEDWICPQVDENNTADACEQAFSMRRHCSFADGIANPFPLPARVEPALRRAVSLKHSGSHLRSSFVWTIERRDTFDHYMKLPVSGALTSDFSDAAYMLSQNTTQLRKATRCDNPWKDRSWLQNHLVANRDRVGAWERFELQHVSPTHVTLKCWNNRFLSAESAHWYHTVVAQQSVADSWERWELLSHSDGTVSFRSHHGLFLCAQGGGGSSLQGDPWEIGLCVADRTTSASWECFVLDRLGENTVAIKTAARSRYLSLHA